MSISWQLFFYLAIIITTASTRAEPLSGNVFPPAPNEFRFIVSIAKIFNLPPNNPLGHVCGGALITRRYVLTAASCFEGTTINNYFVYAGNTDLTKSKVIGIKDVIKFDDWLAEKLKCKYQSVERNYKNNDIAVVKLQEQMQSDVYTAKIWDIPLELLPLALAAQKLTIQTAGWTKFIDGTPPRYMLKTNLQLVNRDKCLPQIQAVSNNPFYSHDVNVFCTIGTELFTVLDPSDKGSPVFVEYEPKKYQVIGINLKSVPETNDITRYSDLRNTHISVHSYISFIRSTTRSYYL